MYIVIITHDSSLLDKTLKDDNGFLCEFETIREAEKAAKGSPFALNYGYKVYK